VTTASIVVNTYNRARSLERLLPSLAQLDGVVFEVVVVNGPSTDDTDAVLARYEGRIKVERCPSANLSRSRNIGIAAAAGDVVVFIDDDALPADPRWLWKILDAFDGAASGRLGAVGGASLHRDTEWTEFAGGWTSDYAEQRFTDGPIPDERGQARWYRRTVGNNSAFRRSALVAIGGFDERFRYYLDEADVCLRLARAGYEVVYLHDAAVRHYPEVSPLGAPFIRDRRLIARSDTYYCLKNGADPLPRRVISTLRRAPFKHFVRELPDLVAERRITKREMWRLRARWLRGLVEGMVEGIAAPRGNHLTDGQALPLVPFVAASTRERLSICLLSRRLPPDPHAGGVGRYTFDLARGLHELGHRVVIVTEGESVNRHEGLGFDVVGVNARPPAAGLRQAPILAQNLAYAEAVLARVETLSAERGPFDVVHATNWGIEALGLAQRRTTALTLMLVTPLESVMAAEGWDLSLDLAANVELDQWVIERATRVCAPSAGVMSRYTSRAGWTGRAIHTTPLGIVCGPPSRRKDEGPRRLLFVGRLERRKGIHVLLQALPALLEKHPGWHCDIVGDRSVLAHPGATFRDLFLEEHAQEAWAKRVAFHGSVADDEVQQFYRNADLFVAPSLFESFGLIYQEAMQYGVPVVGCRAGGVPEVVRHDVHGLLVPPGDAESLETALDRLMSDDELRRRMGARAEADVRKSGSHVAMAERMAVEYRAATAEHAASLDRRVHGDGDVSTESVTDAALAVLEAASPTRGLGLAFRASAAIEHGEHAEAAALVAAALGVSPHPEYLALGLELALAGNDTARALELSARGFDVTEDDSDACLAFAATIIAQREERAAEGFDRWRRARERTMADKLFAAALTAIRSGRDFTAMTLLRCSLEAGTSDASRRAQALYHLGSALKRKNKVEEARATFERAFEMQSALPVPLQAALRFHMGELDLSEGEPAAAIAHFEACLSLNPGHGRARTLLETATAEAAA
jgi:glycosyltransferase involved in cell wall biosynthesis/GT2 family glycosyltransferase